MRPKGWAFGLALLVGLAACGEAEEVRDYGASDEVVARAKVLMPADPELAELYKTTCYYCHAFPESMSPLTGDRRAWDRLMEKGLDVLVKNTIEGYEGMPPLGGCMACSEDEFATLTAYMATAE
jgi:cytochrome c5